MASNLPVTNKPLQILPRVIGLAGAAGSGKDSVAEYLAREYQYARLSWAARLKRGIETIFGVGDWIWNREHKERPLPDLFGATPRAVAQTLGTDWGRKLVRQDLWLLLLLRDIQYRLDLGERVVITDCRFDNEAEAVLGIGGVMIGILRPGIEPVRSHASEQGITPDLISTVLYNDGTLDELPGKIEHLLRTELNKGKLA